MGEAGKKGEERKSGGERREKGRIGEEKGKSALPHSKFLDPPLLPLRIGAHVKRPPAPSPLPAAPTVPPACTD